MAFKDHFVSFQALDVDSGILLRQVSPEKDLEDYCEIYADAEMFRFYEGAAVCRDKARVQKILKNQIRAFERASEYTWTICDKANDKAIGRIHLSNFESGNRIANVGYFINRAYWGKGIISACIGPVADFGFRSLNLERICTTVALDNIGSWKALEKNGFLREGLLRHSFSIQDALVDCYLYARLYTD